MASKDYLKLQPRPMNSRSTSLEEAIELDFLGLVFLSFDRHLFSCCSSPNFETIDSILVFFVLSSLLPSHLIFFSTSQLHPFLASSPLLLLLPFTFLPHFLLNSIHTLYHLSSSTLRTKMPAPLLKQISLWKHQEPNASHPMSYKFLQDEESSSEKGSEQTLSNDDIRPSPRPRERIVFGVLVFIIIILSGLLIDSHRRIQASPPPKPKSPVPDCTSKSWRELLNEPTKPKSNHAHLISSLETCSIRLLPNVRVWP